VGQYEDLYRMGHVRTAEIAEPDDFIVKFSLKLKQRRARRILDVGHPSFYKALEVRRRKANGTSHLHDI
jgi:hypothetical protein